MSSRNSRTIYVGNLPGDIRLREVEDLFYKYGPIVDIDLKIPPRPPGYAFVEFEDVRDAEDAIYGRDGYKFDGLRLRVELAHGGQGHSSSIDRYSSYRVFVTGLPPSASWQDLNDHMRRAGDVCFSEVFRYRGGMAGIVDYTNYDDMKYAIRKLDDSEFRNAFSRSYLRVKEYETRRSYSESPSRDSRSDYSRSPSHSPYKSRYRSRSRSFSRSPSDTGRNPRFILVFLQNLTFFDYFLRFEHFHFSMKHIIKILTLLVAISALWIGLLQTSIVPHGHAWLLPIYFIVSLGCYGLLMVGVGLMRFPTCPGEGRLLQQDIDESKEYRKQRVVVDVSFD